MKKYELTDEYITVGDKKLYRIRALRDFANVKKGRSWRIYLKFAELLEVYFGIKE